MVIDYDLEGRGIRMEYIFEKYRVNGKDYLVYDIKRHQYELTSEKIRRICHHHFGVGVSGLIMGYCDTLTSGYVKSYDINGNLEEQNYTAICAFVQYLKDNDLFSSKEMTIHTISEAITVSLRSINQEEEKKGITQITMSIQNTDLKAAAGAENVVFTPSTISFLSSQVRETGKIITAEHFIQSL